MKVIDQRRVVHWQEDKEVIRDVELIRKIMLELEAAPASKYPDRPMIDGYDEDEVAEHIEMLNDARLIEARITRSAGATRVFSFHVDRVTWAGHEWLANAKNDTAWVKAKEVVLAKGGSVSFDIFTAVLKNVTLSLFGLG